MPSELHALGPPALAQQDGPLGLSVAQLWLSRLLQQLSSRVAAYTSITQLAPATAQVAAAAAGLLPQPAKADAPSPAAAFKATGGSSGKEGGLSSAQTWLTGAAAEGVPAGESGSSGSSWWWWGSSGSTGSSNSSSSGSNANAAATTALPVAGGLTPMPIAPDSSSRSWYWPFGGGDPAAAGSQQHASEAAAPAADGSMAEMQPVWEAETVLPSSSARDAPDKAAGPQSADEKEREALLESARASIWRDAAPVTAASAKAAADDLKAAANAVLTAWLGAAGSLNLPSDLLPGMFVPAVVEAYPTAARVLDFSVAQQRTCQVLEVGWGLRYSAGRHAGAWPCHMLWCSLWCRGFDVCSRHVHRPGPQRHSRTFAAAQC